MIAKTAGNVRNQTKQPLVRSTCWAGCCRRWARTIFSGSAAGIAARGLDEEIVLYQGKILDGWSRYRACQAVRVEPRFREFAGDDPVAYVLAKNVERRHMNPVQILKVLEAARPTLEAEAAARRRTGVKQDTPPSAADPGRNSAQGGRVSEQIAQMAGVAETRVKRRSVR